MNIFDKDTQEYLLKVGRPVLLVGKHGVGKTSVLRSISTNFGLKMHELNASTLDPFVHIVGIPVTHEGKVIMNPPEELQQAEILFIDEINRADRPTRNALFEIVCDNSVNGKKLENLKLVVAAMNPPDGTYHVDALDEAMDDRFLHKFNVEPDISWALDRLDCEKMKAGLQRWYSALDTPPSPRRLTWVVESALKDGINEAALLNALDDTLYGTTALIRMLKAADAGEEILAEDSLLSEDEKSAIAKIIFSAYAAPKYQDLPPSTKVDIRQALRQKFAPNGESFLHTPTAGFTAEEAKLVGESEVCKEIIDLFPFDFTPATSWGSAGSTWLEDELSAGEPPF